MNMVLLLGRLAKDPIERKGKDDLSIAKYTLAVGRRIKTKKDADFIDITSFGSTADFVCKFLKKGTKVIVTGELREDIYTKEDGTKVYNMEVIGTDIEFAESKSASIENQQN